MESIARKQTEKVPPVQGKHTMGSIARKQTEAGILTEQDRTEQEKHQEKLNSLEALCELGRYR